MMEFLRARWLFVGIGVVLAGGLLAWLLWPAQQPPAPRERQYLEATACLLTDDKSIAGEQSKLAWEAMREASEATLVRAQYLAVSGPQTSANALSYFNTLGLQKCGVIIAVGDVPVAAMVEGHARFTASRYLAIGGDTAGTSLQHISVTSKSVVSDLVKSLAGDSK